MTTSPALNEASDYLTQEEVGQRIERLRGERGVSQRRLADAIGVDPSALSRIESGQRGLAVGELVAISEFFGVTTDELLRRGGRRLCRCSATRAGQARRPTRSSRFESIIDDFFAFEAAARA